LFTSSFYDALSTAEITKHSIKFDTVIVKYESEERREKPSITYFTDVVGYEHRRNEGKHENVVPGGPNSVHDTTRVAIELKPKLCP
jgi:hypothetical protein